MSARVKNLVVEKTSADKREINIVFNYVAFHFIVGGYGYFNGKRLGKGDGFVCDIGQLCNYYPDKCDPWEYVWVVLDDFCSPPPLKEAEYLFKFDRCDALRTLCLELSASPEKLKSPKYSEAVFTLLESYLDGFSPEREEREDAVIERAECYMKERIYERVEIADIAKILHISEGYLRHLFKSKKGVSPKSYLDTLKASRAAELLTETDYRIEHVAASVGFADAQAFSKFFKKHHHLSPKDFRRKSREM